MPTLHRFIDRSGFFAKGVANGKPVSFELTPEGIQYLTETLGLDNGAKFSADTLKWLFRKKWAVAMETIPSDLPPAVSVPQAAERVSPKVENPSAAVQNLPRPDQANPVVFPGVMQIRLLAEDHTLLDQAVEELVKTLTQTEAVVLGPFPIPIYVESYAVYRDGVRKEYNLRIYQRLLHVRNPRRLTVDAMNRFSLPREVNVKIEMHTDSPPVR